MARIRSVKPEFWSDYDLAQLSRDARLLYIALWNQADEHSRLHGDPRWVKGHCFPYDDDLNLAAISRLLDELERDGKLTRYVVKGAPYIFLANLDEHQRLEPEKVASKLPAPSEADPAMPDPDPSQRGADSSERRAEKSARQGANPRKTPPSALPPARIDKSAPRADSSEKIVASLGCMEHGAWSMEHGDAGDSAPAARGPTAGQRAKKITDAYAAAEPMCRWPAINGITAKAIKAGRWTDDEIRDALLRLAAERRTVTVDTLRIELDGLPPNRMAPPREADEAPATRLLRRMAAGENTTVVPIRPELEAR
jgi:hypothetical protein